MGYITIKLPEPLIERVEEIIKENPNLGFTNRTQYITSAVRDSNKQFPLKSKNNKKSKNHINPNQTTIPIKNIELRG